MTANGHDPTPAGVTADLLHEEFVPRGWPSKVRITELTAGQVLDMYGAFNDEQRSGNALQMEMLLKCALDAESGQPLFASTEQIRALPARFVPGLMEMVQASARLNTPPTMADDGGRPTSTLNG